MKFFIASLFLLSSLNVFSIDGKRHDRRQFKQKKRIANGVKSGELSKKESRKLIRGQRRINRTEKRFEADGELTAKEKIILEKKQDIQSKRIYKKKHN